MPNQLVALEQAQSTLIDQVIKFGPKVIVAGQTIIFTRPFRVGEYVAIENIRAAGVDYPPATRDIRIVSTSAA